MIWNEVLSNVKQKIRRGFGRDAGHAIQVTTKGARLEPLGDIPLGTPPIDVYENDSEFVIHADVPGGTRDSATIAWDEARGLTLAVKSQPLPPGELWAAEYRPCEWYRSLELPDYVDGSRATCTVRDGVLTVRAPKRAAASLLIPVTAG